VRKGEKAFGNGAVDEEGEDVKGDFRGEVVRGVLEKAATGWCEEQVSYLIRRVREGAAKGV
jgi:hypothetical protein